MKHAFLIMAHKNYAQLDKLINLIDNPRTDIYLHIDERSPYYKPPVCVYSQLIMIPRMRTNWGGYSLVECELQLLERALSSGSYTFFHLISRQDLILKPVSEILNFFDSHISYNFVHFDKPEQSIIRKERVKYYYFFQEIKPRGRSLWSILQRILVFIQKGLLIDRTKKFPGEFKSGSQWWSIKPDLARYIVSQREKIRNLFKYSMCDEMFVQTLVYNSGFFSTLYIQEQKDKHANQRLLKLSQNKMCGSIHIWTMKDIDEIRNSDLLFARKFDENVDSEIIDEVVKMVTRNGDSNCKWNATPTKTQ